MTGEGVHLNLRDRCLCGRHRKGESWDEHINRAGHDLGLTGNLQAAHGHIDRYPIPGVNAVRCPAGCHLMTINQYRALTGRDPRKVQGPRRAS